MAARVVGKDPLDNIAIWHALRDQMWWYGYNGGIASYAVAATEFDTAAWCVYPSRDHVPLKVRAFIDALKESVARSAQGH